MNKRIGSLLRHTCCLCLCLLFYPLQVLAVEIFDIDTFDAPADVKIEIKKHLARTNDYPFILLEVTLPTTKIDQQKIDLSLWENTHCILFKAQTKPDTGYACYEAISHDAKPVVEAKYFKELERKIRKTSNDTLSRDITKTLDTSPYPLILLFVGNKKKGVLCGARKILETKINECIFDIPNEKLLLEERLYIQVKHVR